MDITTQASPRGPETLPSWPVLGRSEKIIIFSNLSGRPARHGSTSEKHYLCDQLPSATRGAGVDTDGPKFERRGLAVQIRGRRSPKPYLNGFQKFSIVKSRLTARPRRSNRAQAIAYLRFERRGLAVQIGLRRSPTSDLNGEASPFKSERRDFNLDPNK